MRCAVVGHIEWVEFVAVDHVPAKGEIVHASDGFAEPAGGGGVAAVQLARLAQGCEMFTALGDDSLADRTRERFDTFGVSVHSARRESPTRRALTFVEPSGERTITTIGERLAPGIDDPLPWERLDSADAAYFTAGDAGALRAARGARVLVATPRAGDVLKGAGVEIDALVFSEDDELERAAAGGLTPPPALLVATRGADGGSYATADGAGGSWEAVTPPGPIIDSYGAGDSFAGALCWALAAGLEPAGAVALAALAGATCLTGRGPYERQLERAEAEQLARGG